MTTHSINGRSFGRRLYRAGLGFGAAILLLVSCNTRVGHQTQSMPGAVITPIGFKSTAAAGAPVAITVRAGTEVTLSAKDSYPNGAALTAFVWTQTSGPALPAVPDVGALLYRSSNTVSFRAPQVTTTTVLGFELSITDARGGTATATATVTVEPADDIDAFLNTAALNASPAPRIFTAAVVTVGADLTPQAADVPICLRVGRKAQYMSRGSAPAIPPAQQTVDLPQLASLQLEAAWTARVGGTGAAQNTAAAIALAAQSYTNPRVVFTLPAFNDEELFAMFNQPVASESGAQRTARIAMQLVPADVDPPQLTLANIASKARLLLSVTATPGSCDGMNPGLPLANKSLAVAILDQEDNVIFVGPASAAGAAAVLDQDPNTLQPLTPDLLLTGITQSLSSVPEIETAATAALYYQNNDPQNTRRTLTDWLTANCFDATAADYGVAAAGASAAHAVYVNNFDLGFGRDMYAMRCTADRMVNGVLTAQAGDLAMVVINYPSLEQAALKQGAFLAVAMEYNAQPYGNGNAPRFTKFYVFAPDDRTGVFRLVSSANFDRRGHKYVPGACTVCHSGSPPRVAPNATSYPSIPDPTHAAPTLVAGDIDAAFLPWDLDSLLYSDTDPAFLGNVIPPGPFERATQEPQLKALNKFAYMTYQTPEIEGAVDRFAAPRELLEQWYGGPGLPNPTYKDTATPAGWAGFDAVYHNVFARNCRACHTDNSNPALHFSDALSLKNNANFSEYVFRRGVMPFARLTNDRFWVAFDQTQQSAATQLINDLFLPPMQVGAPRARIGASDNGAIVFGPNLPDTVTRVQNVGRHDTVRVTGSPSVFADTYAWAFSYQPTQGNFSSTAALVGGSGSEAAFSPDVPGTYNLTLTASNGSKQDAQSASFVVVNLFPKIIGPNTTALQPMSIPFANPQPITLTVQLGDGTCQQHTLTVSASAGSVSAGACSPVLPAGANPQATWPLNYTPAAVGPAVIHVVVRDIDGDPYPASGTFDIYVNVTSSLAANNDIANATAGNPAAAVNICVLNNDTLSGQTVTLSVSTAPNRGSASVGNNAGVCNNNEPYVVYTPPSQFIGADSFGYTITAAGNQSSSATVSVTIKGTIDFGTTLFSTLSGTCASCHSGPGSSPTPYLQGASNTASSFYQKVCGATNPGPCGTVNVPDGPLVDLGTPTNSQLYAKPNNPPSGMPQFTSFASDVLTWINEGAYCKSDGTACP